MPNYSKSGIVDLINSKIELNKKVLSFMKQEQIQMKSLHDAIQSNLHYLHATLAAIDSISSNDDNLNISITEYNKIQN